MSNSDVTAVVLSAADYLRDFDSIDVIVWKSEITNSRKLLNARFDAVSKVETKWFFFLDDDDDLPIDYLDVLNECKQRSIEKNVGLVYTNEIVRRNGQPDYLQRSSPYDAGLHLANYQLVHHLSLCETDAAKRAIEQIPRANLCPELALYYTMAKNGAEHVDRVGYIWNRSPNGMSTWAETALSQVKAALWCRDPELWKRLP